MSCPIQNFIPTLIVKSVSVSGTVATLTVNGLLPSQGRFNIKMCRSCVPVCSNAQSVIITDGITTYNIVLTRCGNDLPLSSLICHLRRFGVAHFCGSAKTAGTAIIQDKLCPITSYTVVAASPAVDNESVAEVSAKTAKTAAVKA